MELKDIYKLNPRNVCYTAIRRDDLVERRKSKRKDCFDQNRNYSEEDSAEKSENKPPNTVTSDKENRRDLLKKWKEERKKESSKNTKKPFIVGIVRHNAGSPLFKPVSPLKEVKQSLKTQVTKPQASTSQASNAHLKTSGKSGVFLFGKQKPAPHQFKVASVKKLTVPINPSFMDATKRGNLASKPKPESYKVFSVNKKTTTRKKAENPVLPTEKRVTRATTAKGAVKKIANENEPSKAGPSRRKTRVALVSDPDMGKTATGIRNIIEDFVFSPQVKIKKEESQITPTEEIEDQVEAQKEMESDVIVTCENVNKPAQEFYDRLQKESDFLLECCKKWSRPAFTQTVPQEISDEIDSTVGQAMLLVSDKFQQFRNLVQRFEEDSKPPVTTDDLNGFWDMMYIQVEKMKDRFDHLAELKNNNWTKKTVEVLVKKKVAAVKPKAKPNVKSRFQEFMAKKRLGNSFEESTECNTTGQKAEEPQLKTDTPTGTPLKERMMQQILNTSRSERRRSSLASASRVLRTSLIAKTLAMSPLVQTGDKSANEARKSILKNNNFPSSPNITSATFTSETKNKVGFGLEEQTVSPAPKRMPRTLRLAFSVDNSSTDDDSGSDTERNSHLLTDDDSGSATERNSHLLTDDDSDSASGGISHNLTHDCDSASEIIPNNLTDDYSDLVTENSPHTPTFANSFNDETDVDDVANDTLPKSIPLTPRFFVSPNCETDYGSDSSTLLAELSSCSVSRRRSSRLRSNIQEFPHSLSVKTTKESGKMKKIGAASERVPHNLIDDDSGLAISKPPHTPRFTVSFNDAAADDTRPKSIPLTPRSVASSKCETDDGSDSSTLLADLSSCSVSTISRSPRLRSKNQESPLSFSAKAKRESGKSKKIGAASERVPHNLIDDDSDLATGTPRFTVSFNDAAANDTRPKRIPLTPRSVASSKCETDDDSDSSTLLAELSSCSVSTLRRSPRLRSNIQESAHSFSAKATKESGNRKKIGFSKLEVIESDNDANVTPVPSASFESPKIRRSTRLRINTPYSMRK